MSNNSTRSSARDRRRQQSIRAYARRSEPAGDRPHTHSVPHDDLLPFGKPAARHEDRHEGRHAYRDEAGCEDRHSARHDLRCSDGRDACGRPDAPGHRDRCTRGDGCRCRWCRALGILTVVAGIVLLVSLSWEMLTGDHRHFSSTYLWIQFGVCLVFLADFFLRWSRAEPRGRFFWRHLPYLLLAIPWLNLLDWCGVGLTHDWGLLVGLMPVLRAFLAMYLLVAWVVRRRNCLRRLFWAYILTVVLFTYLSALLFYDSETGLNTQLAGFGDALWWAWMNVTTVGSKLFAVTCVGKVVTVLLPLLGMLFFPIFTAYLLDRCAAKRREL